MCVNVFDRLVWLLLIAVIFFVDEFHIEVVSCCDELLVGVCAQLDLAIEGAALLHVCCDSRVDIHTHRASMSCLWFLLLMLLCFCMGDGTRGIVGLNGVFLVK